MRSIALLAAAALLASPTLAEPGKGKGQGQGGGKPAAAAAKPNKGNGLAAERGRPDRVVERTVVEDRRVADRSPRRVAVRSSEFFDRDREALIRRYYGTSVACPPGLAAKNNGCLPPGQAKKVYGVGTILPRDVYLAPLPRDLLGRLPVAPVGYSYGRYYGDVYLVEDTTRRIVDSIVFNLLR